MTRIHPINGHLLIEPIAYDGFMQTHRQSYQEIGRVISRDAELAARINEGDKVYFDAWLAKKYPKEGGEPDEFYWLVKFEDVTAVEYVEQQISE